MTTEELLKVLDMSEYEQWDWLEANKIIVSQTHKLGIIENAIRIRVLADLAFRLRDETSIETTDKFSEGAFWVVHHKSSEEFDYEVFKPMMAKTLWYFLDRAKPIEWIIAALIAKEMANEK